MIRHLLQSNVIISIAALTMTCLFSLGPCPLALAGGIPINPCVPPQQYLGGPPVSGIQILHNSHYQRYGQPGASVCVPQKIKRPISRPPGLLPIRLLDPGPVRPVVTNAVGLVGGLLAAPFRVIEAVIPPVLPQQNNLQGQGLGCRPQTPFRAQACGSEIPPAVVAENRFPVLEPQSLLMGVINFPFTLFGQGKFAGDFGESNQ